MEVNKFIKTRNWQKKESYQTTWIPTEKVGHGLINFRLEKSKDEQITVQKIDLTIPRIYESEF